MQTLFKIYAWLRAYGKTHREPLMILAALVILFEFPNFIRGIDPSAAPLDPGVLSAIVYACVTLMIFKLVVWRYVMRVIWPLFYKYSNESLENDFYTITPWQRLKTYLLFSVSFVALLILTLKVFL